MDHDQLYPFHLAFPVDDISAARDFFVDVIGCPPGRRQTDRVVDFKFFGHHVIAHLVEGDHATVQRAASGPDTLAVRHFGAVLPRAEWDELVTRLERAGTTVVYGPEIRREGEPDEEALILVTDPSGNVIEFKGFRDDRFLRAGLTMETPMPTLPTSMNAAVVTGAGDVDVLDVVEIDLPRVGPADVLVRVDAAALNFRDTKQRRDPPPTVVHPYVPGSDFAGTVVAVGDAVTARSVGNRVVGAAHEGACARYIAVHEAMVMPVPGGITPQQAATLPVSGLTASFLMSVADLRPGSVAVVHAAAGGLGCYLGGLLTAAGIRALGLTSSPTKIDVARAAGFADVVNYTEADPVAEVLRLTRGRGADVVFDSIAGPRFARSFAMLANEGTAVLCGRSAGDPDLATITDELVEVRRNRALREFYLNTHIMDHLDQIPQRIAELGRLVADGTVKVPITTYPLTEIRDAHHALEQGGTVGKLIVVPTDGEAR